LNHNHSSSQKAETFQYSIHDFSKETPQENDDDYNDDYEDDYDNEEEEDQYEDEDNI
jgi:hypothetical protein